LNDLELIKRTLAGDIESFGQIVIRHRGAVQGMAYHQVGNFEDAEDIAQETFVTAFLKLGQLRQPECFTAWLRQLTLNYCRKWMKKQRPMTPFDEIEDSANSSTPSPAEVLEGNEVRWLVHKSLQKLSENNRLAITLYYLGDMSYQEIARFLDVSLSTVEGRMHRARKQLKGNLMETIENSLRGEQLDDDFTRKVLEQARKRAKEAQAQWHREDFVLSVRKGLEAAEQLRDTRVQMEMLSMLGEAGTTWLGETANAIENYESALMIARKQDDAKEEAGILRALYEAHVRHGEWEKLGQRAREAREMCRTHNDLKGQAQAQAALDLAVNLPGVWSPDQAGGYALADFPVEVGTEGYRWLDPVSVRNYSWGCPSRCATLIHLFRPRRFLGPSFELGAHWEDLVDHKGESLSWGIHEADPEPVARSQVESIDDVVVTPAGRFSGCLRVKTEITAPKGRVATEHRTRSYCGTRTTWFAPGVGLVKLRHKDQNGTAWVVHLIAHEGPEGIGVFPTQAGHMWRYRWLGGDQNEDVFEDVCRVVGSGETVMHLSSATWGVEQSKGKVLGYWENLLELERAASDPEGQAIALEGIIRCCEDEERIRACRQQLVVIHQQSGNQWGLLMERQALRSKQKEIPPAEEQEGIEERLELARRLGDRRKEMDTLRVLGDHHLKSGGYGTAARFFEESATAAREEGDIGEAAMCVSLAELARAMQERPEGPHCAYRHGEGYLTEKGGTLGSEGSSRTNYYTFPPGSPTTPMTDFLWLTPFDGIKLLSSEVGESCTDWHNTGLGGICESMRVTSTLRGKEKVEVPAGCFSGCARIETVISTSAEGRPLDGEHLEQVRGYYAGVKETWFAPGIGVVKLHYAHQNGHETSVELVEYQIAEESESYLPLALSNRWRYCWTDQGSGIRFEDLLRMAAHREGQWNISFVTRAQAAEKSE
jgi:RNA polymerase sigma-70 factor, ECF subfamily